MMKATLKEVPDAGNPHVWLGEGNVAPAKPGRGSLRYHAKNIACGFALAALCLSTAYGASPVEWLWNKGAGGVPPAATPYDWTDAANWGDGASAPQGSNKDFPVFPLTGNLFVQLPETSTIGALARTGSTGTLYLLGSNVTVRSDGWSGKLGTTYPLAAGRLDGGDTKAIRLYANVTAPKDLTGRWSIAGDLIVTNGDLTSSIGEQRWRGDWYANDATGIRSNAFRIAYINNSSSSMGFIGPAGTVARDSTGWSLTEGSAFVKYAGSAIGTIAPGCAVSGSGIADGTFLKRYFDDLAMIELSKPATATVVSGTLHFGAYEPITTGYLARIQTAGDGNIAFYAQQPNKLGSFTLDIGKLECSKDHMVTFVGGDSGALPAKLVIHRSSSSSGWVRFRYTTDFVFTKPTAGVAGLAYVKGIKFEDNATHRVTVEEAVAAVYTNICELSSNNKDENTTLIKAGAGALTLDFTNTFATIKSKFRAEEGTLVLAPRAKAATFTGVTVTNGATLRARGTSVVLSGITLYGNATVEAAAGTTVDLSSVTALPAGVRLAGEGTFVLSSLDVLKNAVTGVDATFRLKYEGDANSFKATGAITPQVVGEPAFWVDAAREVTLFATNGTSIATGKTFSYTDCVACWRDCRYADDPVRYGAVYATNDFTGILGTGSGTAPSRYVANKANALPCIKHWGDLAFGTTAGMSNIRFVYAGMTWNKPITNICAVFTVVYQDGGSAQCILGGTHRFPDVMPSAVGGDFARALDSSVDGGGVASPEKVGLLSVRSADCVKNGWNYFNGVRRAWNSVNCVGSSVEIIEAHPLAPGGRADAFAIQDYGSKDNCTASGCQWQFETIVYTNRLTMAERAQVCAYLMKKYTGQDYSVAGGRRYEGSSAQDELTVAASGGCAVSVDDVAYVERLSGTGTFTKRGDGTFYADLVTGASLAVEAGTLVVHSATRPTDYAALPANHFIHWDAANTNNMNLLTHTDTINDGFDEQGEKASGYSFNVVVTNEVRHWYDAQYGNDGQHIYGTYRHSDPAYRCGWLVTNALNGLPCVDYGPLFTYKTNMSHNRRYFHEFHREEKNVFVRASPVKSVFQVKNTAAGGNWVLGDTASGHGIARQTTSADYTQPILQSTVGGVTASLNGTEIDPTKVGYTGGWDLLALHANVAYDACTVGGAEAFVQTGGMKLGEMLVYTNVLGWVQARTVEAYLNGKWFNRLTPYASPSTAGTVTVAAGATLTVEGDVPLTVTSLAGEGTVSGDVTLAADAVLDVVVNEDGSLVLPNLQVTGTVDLSAGGTVRVMGNLKKLRGGVYRLLTASSVTSGTGVWTCQAQDASRLFKVRASTTALELVVNLPGTFIYVR